MGGFINRFCNGMSTGKAPIMIWSLLLSTNLKKYYAISRCRYQLMHPGFLTRLTEIQSWSLSLDPSVTTFELDRMRFLQRYQSPTRLPSEQAIYSKSLFAGPLRLYAWIWSPSRRFGHTALTLQPVGMVIFLRQTLWGFVHKFSHKKLKRKASPDNINCDVFHMSLLECDH